MSTQNHIQDRRLGLSQVEIVVSTLIVGIMLVASLDTVGAVYRTQKLNALRLAGPGLAQELMSEILSMPYEDPENPGGSIGSDSGESNGNRFDYDDVDDYDGWNASDAEDKNGVPLPGYNGWQRSVSVTWATLTNGGVWAANDTGLKRITVTVTDPRGKQTILDGMRHKDGMLERSPVINTTVVSWIGAELQLGTSPQTMRVGTELPNYAVDSN